MKISCVSRMCHTPEILTMSQMHDTKLNVLLSVLTSSQWGQHICAILLKKFRRNLCKGRLTLRQVCPYSFHTTRKWNCWSLSHVQFFATPGSIHGILQARIMEWVAIPFSKGSFQLRDQTQVSCIAGRFFAIWATKGSPILQSLS